MAKKEQTNTMAAWLWRAPVKFTGLFVGGITLVILALTLMTMPFAKPLPGWMGGVMSVIVCAFVGFSIYKLIKFTPAAPLDRKSFIGVDIGITVVSVLFYLILPLIMLVSLGFTSYEQFVLVLGYVLGILATTNPGLFFVIALVLGIAVTYIMGLMLSNYIIIFRRGQMMGVSKLKLWLSFPFGMHLLWLPEYFLAEEKKTKPAVQFKSKWYSDFMNWIMKRPLNAIIVWVVMMAGAVVSTLVVSGDFANLLLEGVTLILFVAPLAILGCAKFKKAVPGWFTWMTVVVNILAIVATVCYVRTVAREIAAEQTPSQVIENTNPGGAAEFVPTDGESTDGLYHTETITE